MPVPRRGVLATVIRQNMAYLPLAGWVALYPLLTALDFLTLRSNAFDLSLFDYALWGGHSGSSLGMVPFLGHRLQAEHFMPTFFLLTPLHWIWSSPAMLIVVQNCAVMVAAALYATMAKRRVPSIAAFVLVLAFLASRKSHSAFISTFYPESLEPALILGFVLAAQHSRWPLYWSCVLLALGCKEDVALYVVSYGLLLAISRSTRRQGILTAFVAAAWLAVAVGVVIPRARADDGLPSENPFLAGRYGPSPVTASVTRIASQRSLSKFVNLSAATGLLAWVDPAHTAIVLPGVAVNLAADSSTLQSGLVGHYLWPMLPFLFLAALDGYARLARWNRKVADAWLLCLAALTLLDSPIRPASILKEASEYSAAMAVRRQLWSISADRVVLAQPQLIPHLEKRLSIQAIGKRWDESALADDVLFCPIGDQWPIGQTGFTKEVNRYATDPRYQIVNTGTALVHFRLRR